MKGKNILITGGAGFIGSHLVRLMVNRYAECVFVNLDALTYAGNTEKLKDIENFTNYHFLKGNISDAKCLKKLFTDFKFDGVIHLAAESHVDQSIKNPFDFAKTNVIGTLTLLDAALRAWEGNYENKLVSINIGRYGIYLKHGDSNYSMKGQPIETLDQAIELIKTMEAEKANREINTFDHKGDTIYLLNGRYGPYISFKKKNYRIPKDKEPTKLTLEECIDLIENAPKKGARRRKK